MTSRIFRSIIIASLLTLLATIIIIVGVLYERFEDLTTKQLQSQLDLVSQGITKNGIDYIKEIPNADFRFTLIANDGDVVFDNAANEKEMDNHFGREEINEAIEKGFGESTRFSNTRMEKTIYYAKKLHNGDILRVSTTQDTIVRMVIGIINPIILILILAIILSAILAKRMSVRIVKPLNVLNLDNPLENEVYEEISPLLSHIERQNRKIKIQIEALKKNQNEFNAIIENMNEGLAILNADGDVLALNRSAEILFDTNKDCIGKSFLSVERSIDIDNAIKTAKKNGHSEINISRQGKEYQLNANAIFEGEKVTGVILLTFDVTDKVFAERNRKEFTANVSHELKTPLQSIMGSSELIENGLVKEGDIPSFIGKIRTEATRLVNLVDDIIGLSRLDEKEDIVLEEVDLYSVAKDVINELEHKAKQKNIDLIVDGTTVIINSEKRLIHEIIYNLCDNAIKYNKENGKVEILVDNTKKLIVKDNGIGIAPEHQTRVFERFYRANKSHSKEIGGTGLGLSIVKHACEVLGARYEMVSEEGVGTQVKVEF